MKLLFSIILIFIVFDINAQIRGKIIDSVSKKPLAYASVYLTKAKMGTFTNDDGFFKIPLKSKNDTLMVRFLSYKYKIIPIEKDTVITILMERNPIVLSEVEITNYDEHFLAETIHRCIIKHSKFSKKTNCKSFVKLNTFQDDTVLCESFEAFYNSIVNAFWVENNMYKNGKLLQINSQNKFSFKTLDLFTYIIPNLKISLNSTPKSNPKITTYYHKKRNISLYFLSPIITYFTSDIYKNYNLTAHKLSNNNLKIIYISKVDSNIFGSLVIDTDKNLFKKISLNHFYIDYSPIESTNSKYVIDNVLLNLNIEFQKDANNIYPHLITTDFSFDYTEKATSIIRDINISSKQLIYDYTNSFSLPQPDFINKLNDYQSLSIIPIVPELWKNELILAKTKSEVRLQNKMHKFNNTLSKYCVWTENWKLDWNRVVVIKNEKIKNTRIKKNIIVRAEAFIMLDFYKMNNQYIVNSVALFDYSTCRIPIDEKNKEMKSIIENYFLSIHNISKSLETHLKNDQELNDNKISKYYKKAKKQTKKAKKVFIKKQRRYFADLRKK